MISNEINKNKNKNFKQSFVNQKNNHWKFAPSDIFSKFRLENILLEILFKLKMIKTKQSHTPTMNLSESLCLASIFSTLVVVVAYWPSRWYKEGVYVVVLAAWI